MEGVEETTNVRVRFVTMNETIRVTTDPFSVPSTLGRKGLSELISHLLGVNSKGNQSFDFLVFEETNENIEVINAAYIRNSSKHLLKRSLQSHFADTGMSDERLITIEYTLSIPRPSNGPRTPLPDWVGSLSGSDLKLGTKFFAGCYDGSLRVVDQPSGDVLCEVAGHDGAIKAVSNMGGLLVSGGQDKTVRTWRLNGTSLVPLGIGEGGGATRLSHENSVECVAVGANGILSGDWDGRLCLWSVDEGDEVEVKKRKVSDASSSALRALNPTAAWKAHAHCVAQVEWLQEAADAVTCSWDHSIKTWSVERQDCISTINCSKVNTCMSYSPDALATGSSDGIIRLWDLRSSACAATLGAAGAGWVSGLSWSAESAHLLASAAHDGFLRIFDKRTSKPLFSLRAHGSKVSEEKSLCVAWTGSVVASGGSDSQVKAFQFDSLSPST